MRILLVTQYYPPEVGAAAIRMRSWADALVKNGFEVEVVTALPNYPTGRIFDEYAGRRLTTERLDGIPVHRVWLHAAQGSGLRRTLGHASFAFTLPLALRRVARPDIVLVNSSPLTFAPVGLAAARLWGATAVLSISDLWPQSLIDLGAIGDGAVARLLERLERSMYRRFDVVNAVTSGIRDELLGRHRLAPSKVTYLPNGVDTNLFTPDAPPQRLAGAPDPARHPVFVFPGTMGLFNGLDTVLEAMQLLGRRHREIRFAFVGDGSDRRRLEARAQAMGLDSVAFVDPVPPDRIAGYLPACAGGVVCLKDLPITVGARPAKTFPIMGAGRPLIFVGRGEGADMVEAANCGLVVAPGDPVGLARAMVRIVAEPDEADDLGRNGRRFAVDNLSWHGLVEDWLGQLDTDRPALPSAA